MNIALPGYRWGFLLVIILAAIAGALLGHDPFTIGLASGAMTVVVQQGTGASTGTFATVTAVKWSRVDDATGTTVIPTPTSTGTNFSFIKTFQINITATGSLSMTNVLVGKVANETTTGTKLWRVTSHASYTQATAAPTATGDNNSTAPTMNGASGTALELISAPPSAYAAGAFNTTGLKGNMVEICLGVDATNTTAGSAVATPTLRWSWTES